MSKVVGANVLRTAKLEDAYAKAEQDVRDTMVVSATAQWHEDQNAKSMSKSLIRKRDQEAIAKERQAGANELLVRRSQRLAELYEAEREQWEKELSDQGLVIARGR
mmetsp:Transcript_50138/g.125030  ORF Transcript_50138/g.125030 Transcript_50138/m.125030 type:complete len:106 (-) Transcript_50138:117-434(-)